MSEVYRIADMNLQWIDFFKKKYQVTDAVTLHGREPELTYVFAQKREAFLDAYVNRHLTGRNGMEEALKDYVCMPAMPYYLYGTKDVIEVNRLEEYPSIEKCKRAHRGAFRLHPMLFPQGVSANGKTARFYAAREFKEYVEWNRDSL